MKKYLFLLIISLMAMTSCQKSREEVFEEWAKSYTKKHCPVLIDEFTRMDSMVYFPLTNTHSYYYAVTGSMDNADSMRNDKEELTKSLTDGVINSIDFKPYKDYHTTLEFIYYSDKTKKEMLKIAVTPQMYD